MKKIAFWKSDKKYYINIDGENHYIGRFGDGPLINIDELLQTLHEEGIIEYQGLFIEDENEYGT